MLARPRHARAALTDLLCLAVFVLAGRQSHDIDSGISWYVTVLWPIVVGWFAVALASRLYTAPAGVAPRLAVTIVLGTALGLVLRAAVTQRSTPPAFVAVAFLFIAVTTAGWRVLAGPGRRRLPWRR